MSFAKGIISITQNRQCNVLTKIQKLQKSHYLIEDLYIPYEK